jgi:hypothetical protein
MNHRDLQLWLLRSIIPGKSHKLGDKSPKNHDENSAWGKCTIAGTWSDKNWTQSRDYFD